MRKWVGLVGVAIVVVLLAMPANGVVSVLPGLNDTHLKDLSNFFTPAGAPRSVTDAPVLLDELRTVFRIDSMQLVPGGTPYWLSQTTSGDELTGLMYDLKLNRTTGSMGTGDFRMFFTPMGRNPLVDANDKDLDIGTWAPSGSLVHGGVIELYQDASPDLNAELNAPTSGVPGLWNTAPKPVRPITGTLADSYPAATDGTLWLSGVLLDLSQFGAGNPGEVYSLIQTGATTFSGTGYLHVYDGMVEPVITGSDLPGSGPGALLADATLQTTVRLGVTSNDWANPNWQGGSSDPVEFNATAIPEPTIMLLFGASIVGGLIRRRRV